MSISGHQIEQNFDRASVKGSDDLKRQSSLRSLRSLRQMDFLDTPDFAAGVPGGEPVAMARERRKTDWPQRTQRSRFTMSISGHQIEQNLDRASVMGFDDLKQRSSLRSLRSLRQMDFLDTPDFAAGVPGGEPVAMARERIKADWPQRTQRTQRRPEPTQPKYEPRRTGYQSTV